MCQDERFCRSDTPLVDFSVIFYIDPPLSEGRQIHKAKEEKADNGVYLCAASKEQAERAVELIGDNCQLIETEDSNHNIHGIHTQIYLDAINSFLKEGME